MFNRVVTLGLFGRNSEGERIPKMEVYHYIFLIFWILKPFYLAPSGNMQISDFIFITSFITWIILNRGEIYFNKQDVYLLIFIIAAVIINFLYWSISKHIGYLMSSSYYIYNFLVIVSVSDYMKNKLFLKSLFWVSIFNLFVQFAVLILGFGEYFGGIRFMGTFNDPNQFSFSVFTTFLIIFILSTYFSTQAWNKQNLLIILSFLMITYFIIQGSSTGMLLGLIVFIASFVVVMIYREKGIAFTFLKFLGILLILSLVIFILFSDAPEIELNNSPESQTFLISRLKDKIEKFSTGGFNALMTERGINKLYVNSQYVVYGAGEGDYDRFPESPWEVHSTFPGILFYYGFIPFIILLIWIWSYIKQTRIAFFPIYMALFIEGLTLANQRQPAFWMIIVLGSYVYTKSQDRIIFQRAL